MSIDNFLLSSNTTDLNYPEIRPTLDLNFARVKALDPRITFTRASGGSYVGADGLIKYAGVNEPRFDHDLSTGESLGLLVEESRTNLFTYSGNLQNPDGGYSWSFENTYSAPDGGNTASKVTQLNGNASTIASWFVINDTIVTYTMFTKEGSGFTTRRFGCYNNSQAIDLYYVDFNYNTGIASPVVFNGTTGTHSVDYYGNGWYRIRVTITSNITSGNYLGFYYGDVGGPKPETIGSYFYVWGGQIEQGEFPTSYIPTVGSSRTRAADSVIMFGTNFTNWYNKSEGTFIFELNKTGYMNGYYSALFYVVDSYVRNEMYKQSGNSRILYQYGDLNLGITYASLEITDGISSGKNIIFAHYKENDFGLGVNGIIKSTDNSGKSSVPFGSSNPYISFGSYNGSSEFWNAHIKKITYYPKRLTNQQLQVLTR